MANNTDTVIDARRVSKFFGGVQAVKNVSFTLFRNEILGLIGPNGAGKTTLFNIIAGVYHPSNGSIYYKSINIGGLKPHKICHLGIARTFQIVKPFPTLTVLENVMIGAKFGNSDSLFHQTDFRGPAFNVLEFIGIQEKADVPCGALNLGEIKKVELARALATNPEVVLLDEVIAGLNLVETESMMELIRKIRDDRGITILMIEHVMKAVMGISDRIMVLHHGEKIAEGPPEEVVSREEVLKAYLGERIL